MHLATLYILSSNKMHVSISYIVTVLILQHVSMLLHHLQGGHSHANLKNLKRHILEKNLQLKSWISQYDIHLIYLNHSIN